MRAATVLSVAAAIGASLFGGTIEHVWASDADTVIICIDAGHGGAQSGSVGTYYEGGAPKNVYEKRVNLSVALLLRDTLNAMAAESPDFAGHILSLAWWPRWSRSADKCGILWR